MTLLGETVIVNNESMELDEYTRWMCMYEAIEIIENKASHFKMNLDKRSDWIKPLAIQKYISERFLSMKYEIVTSHGGNINSINHR